MKTRTPLKLRRSSGLQPSSKEAFQLLMQGSIAMSRMERVGLRVDVRYLEQAIKDTEEKVRDLEKQIESAREYRVWGRHFGNKMNLRSRTQLGQVMFEILGHKRNPFLGQTNDVAAFEHLKSDFVRNYHDIERLKKALSTNLYGIQREVVDGRIHPHTNLYTAESYRSSQNAPNMQNQPVRNKDISAIVRTMIIPDPGCILLEGDFNAHEVRTSYMYHKDPKMYDYIMGGGDMHTDKAMELFCLSKEELGNIDKFPGDLLRYAAKNLFVFRQFYGGVFFQAAPELWNFISLYHLTTAQGVPIHEHLAAKGIKKLGKCDPQKEPVKGTYEYHVREVERSMWNKTFPVYAQWKKDWWEKYQRQGGVNSLTGFKMEGVFRRNQILCDVIQGSAFQILLWSIIQEQMEVLKRKLKSRIWLQVHDSQLWNIHRKELDDIVGLIKEVCLERVVKHWKWINIPLKVKMEASDSNWFRKGSFKLG